LFPNNNMSIDHKITQKGRGEAVPGDHTRPAGGPCGKG
jgi:hypothetical protein